MLKTLAILLGCMLVAAGGTYALYTQTDAFSGRGGCNGGGCASSQLTPAPVGCCSHADVEVDSCCAGDELQLARAADPTAAVCGSVVFAVSSKKAHTCCAGEAPAAGAEAVAGAAATAVVVK